MNIITRTVRLYSILRKHFSHEDAQTLTEHILRHFLGEGCNDCVERSEFEELKRDVEELKRKQLFFEEGEEGKKGGIGGDRPFQ